MSATAPLVPLSIGPADAVEISLTPVPGYDHFIEHAGRLEPPWEWIDLPNGPHNSGRVIDGNSATNRYYRARIVRPGSED